MYIYIYIYIYIYMYIPCRGPVSLPICLTAPPLPPTSLQSGGKSSLSISLICTTRRRISASAGTNIRPDNCDLIAL